MIGEGEGYGVVVDAERCPVSGNSARWEGHGWQVHPDLDGVALCKRVPRQRRYRTSDEEKQRGEGLERVNGQRALFASLV